MFFNGIYVLMARQKGKTPPKKWPPLPPNLGGKNPKWNRDGYWKGENDNFVWDDRNHGAGVDRGNGKQDGHWDSESGKGRYDRNGNPIGGKNNKIEDMPSSDCYVQFEYYSNTQSLTDSLGFGGMLGGTLLYLYTNDNRLDYNK